MSRRQPHPPIWPFPTYKGQPYRAPRRKRARPEPKQDLPDALF